ncbi:Tripartite motif-containing protein 5 [Wickerhamomyces ciferrii]|uniref:Tripartite motif-containing protein 5 n=1 Tax=Wickerhamomyces ciferrii (strain ATCC 14091 / BCRC 22168 / CBS 111 / JCM 3599 / NBRC 0793 / NRRL Y-1031 F-60-10) TaxID=1206466 RepID=K0KWZ7_WICCF|nr:Tripartite motif-containing protein 5 [Wickerhamomyces ciferrii]CCH46014.1 Tripartite motif-containing protein 5 [Wickerhamomyces ciferrii]
MSEDQEACTICLDQLFQIDKSEFITRLQPCGHYYHTECIKLWTDKSNSCPTCRRDFEFIETIDKDAQVLTRHKTQKKVLEHVEEFFYTDEDVLLQFEEEDHLQRRINNMIASYNTCVLCDSRRGNVSPCNSCSSTFHLSCLGASNLTSWYCPMCDAEQINFERPSIFRRSRNSAVTNRVYNSFRDSLAVSPVTVEVQETVEPMTIEEQQSWEVFENARKEEIEQVNASNSNNTSDEPVTSSETRKLKRPSRRGIRRGVSNNTNNQTLQNQDQNHTIIPDTQVSSLPNTSTSVVNTILNQMKENRQRETPLTKQQIRSNISLNTSASQQSLSLSASSSAGSSPQQTISSLATSVEKEPTSPTNKSVWKMPLVDNTLTLEQKNVLQGIVRDKLRPIYRDGSIDVDQYTAINKKVSHILYDLCLHGNEDYDYEQLANEHVIQEIMDL